MKLLQLTILLVLTQNSYSLESDWKLMGQPNDGYIWTLACHDSNNCYIIAKTTHLTNLFFSTDKGETWDLQFSRDVRTAEKPFVNNTWGGVSPIPSHYYMYFYKSGEIHKSIDSGRTFERITLYEGFENIEKIAMLDTNVGIAIAQYSLYFTFDGWKTFEVRDSSHFKGYQHIEFISDSIVRGLVYNYRNTDASIGPSIVDYNVFTNEIREVCKFLPQKGQVYSDVFEDFYIVSDSVAYVAGRRLIGIRQLYNDVISKTTDGGRTWTKVFDSEQQPSAGILSISFFDENNGFAVARYGKLYTTNNGGRTWKLELLAPILGELDKPYLVSTSLVWAGHTPIIGSSRGYIYRYEGDYFVFDGKYKGNLSISGRVLDNGVGVQGITLFNGDVSTTTDVNGYYEFPYMEPGTYKIAPDDLDYTYAPQEVTIKLTENRTNIDFIATPTNRFFSLSGRVTLNGKGVKDVLVKADDYGDLTDENGYYEYRKIHKSANDVLYINSYYTMTARDSYNRYLPETRYMILVSDTTNIDFNLDIETSVEVATTETQEIYPNPVENFLNILNYATLTKAEIYNADSKLIMTAYTDLDKLDVSYLHTGAYILKLTDINSESTILKFIKQ